MFYMWKLRQNSWMLIKVHKNHILIYPFLKIIILIVIFLIYLKLTYQLDCLDL